MRGEVAAGDELINITSVKADTLPSSLIERALGRLEANASSKTLGLLSVYMKFSGGAEPAYFADQQRTWMPSARAAQPNPNTRVEALNAVDRFFRTNYRHFLDTPRHDPERLN